MTDRAAVKDGVLAAMREFRDGEHSALVSLAATIAAGIEASNPEWNTPPELVAKRAVEVARAVVAEVALTERKEG